MEQLLPVFWNMPAPQVLEQRGSGPQGLSNAQGGAVFARYGPNALRPTSSLSALRLLLKQFQSPITLILIGAATLSLFLGDITNATIILAIVVVSSVLGFWQERGAADARGAPSDLVARYACLNATYASGYLNPIDEAIRPDRQFDLTMYQKLDEVPYDFIRKRLSILVAHDAHHLMITKGALHNVLAVCRQAEVENGQRVDLEMVDSSIQATFEELSQAGFRTLGLAYRDIGDAAKISKTSEAAMIFLGFLVLADPPKQDITTTIQQLARLGITLKVITGDNRAVTVHLAQQIGLSGSNMLTGEDVRAMSSEALTRRVSEVNLFAEIEPNQKEQIILALKKAGQVVGYMGDGINDASALHAADVGISVESAVDVAREAADIVLLEQDLGVLLEGVKQGRITFANTLKYVFMATSANFGNMFRARQETTSRFPDRAFGAAPAVRGRIV